jgi:hypothetical protein
MCIVPGACPRRHRPFIRLPGRVPGLEGLKFGDGAPLFEPAKHSEEETAQGPIPFLHFFSLRCAGLGNAMRLQADERCTIILPIYRIAKLLELLTPGTAETARMLSMRGIEAENLHDGN